MKYCDCGKGNDFSANFCCKCGKSFVSLGSVASVSPEIKKSNSFAKQELKPQRSFAPQNDDDDDDAGYGDEHIPNISQLEVNVEPDRSRKVTIGDLYGTSSRAPRSVSEKDKKIKINKKSILEEFKRESSAIKPK